jgi:tetratricopeptide (TPR) repeat protein
MTRGPSAVFAALQAEITATIVDARHDTPSTLTQDESIDSGVFEGIETSRDLSAGELTNQAFQLVERGEYDSAVRLLRQAIRIDPLCGHAHNELAYIYGRIRGDLDLAEEHARRAVECDPSNPKFYNAINGIQLDRAKGLKTRREVRDSMRQRLQEVQRNIDNDPAYSPAYLTKAVALALSGEPKDIWEAELDRAEQLYEQRKISAAGLPLTPYLIKGIIARNHNLCLEMSSYWESLPKPAFDSKNETHTNTDKLPVSST